MGIGLAIILFLAMGCVFSLADYLREYLRARRFGRRRWKRPVVVSGITGFSAALVLAVVMYFATSRQALPTL